jgi:Ran GTPase-activating protein (RanGAP) involved in mRNA processing and transport
VKTEDPPANEKDCTKKKEKKKRSEEERKARKEKKRKLAEANGTVPVELVRNPSDSSLASTPPGSGTPKTQSSPTTDPVRIYRRCCQLRETPILKKITEQLGAPSNASLGQPGIINKLDLSGYWLQLPDLVTLGDYLAIVPVRELVMENCGLTCEGVRVILAGLLATKPPDFPGRRKTKANNGGKVTHHGGVVERVVFKNNTKIGREGWRYICLFMHMSRSLKCMDLSNIPFPQTPTSATSHRPGHLKRSTSTLSISNDTPNLLAKAIGERLAGPEFELLNMAETGITTEQLGGLIDGVSKSGLRRLGLAGNNITPEGMEHVARYLREGKCEGLDLCGNDLKDLLKVLADALDESHSLFALSLADCNLTPDSLWKLFPALAKLRNFRFIDLSHNHDLFTTQPNALSLLCRYLPKMPILKRIHLTDVAMAPEQAIALAEILPESPGLAHVNIMENPQLAALANARDEANQEEACALYASLMAAARVSKTIVCIDIDVPSSDSSEIVKALAKQVVAYCLRNMERDPVAEINHAAAEISEPHGSENEIAVPDVLLHLVGHVEGFHENHDDDEPAPDEDYVIGGTGVVKALGICLRNKGDDSRRHSADVSDGGSGSASPKPPVRGGKAKDMSKNLLGSARKIRARLQPALVKEARAKDRMNYNRLLFLDQTLEGMIKRFEDEFPETRLPSTITSPPIPDAADASPSEGSISASLDAHCSDIEPALVEAHASDDEDLLRPVLSRHNSDVSLASKALSQEEGRMHRFGQQFRRDILKPEQEDHEHGTTGKETEAAHLQVLRAMVEGMGGEEIKKKIENHGQDAIIQELSKEASLLKEQLREADPEGWDKFVEAQEAALRNSSVAGLTMSVSAID